MKTVREFGTKQELIQYLKSELDRYSPNKHDCSNITIKPYAYDPRIDWNTHIVVLKGYGCLGYTNKEVQE
jgi:hypothetical protein